MNEPSGEVVRSKAWYRRELTIFIGGSLVVAFLLVVISMVIYNSSGAAQLDLSRPGYQSVQDEVNPDTFEGFPSEGPVTRNTIEQFKQLYTTQTSPVTDKNVFSPSALDDKALGIDDGSDKSN